MAKGLSLSSEYSLKLATVNDGLLHRPRSNWTIEYTNCQVGTSDIWIQSMTSIDDPPQENSSHSRQESTDTLDNSANETGDASSLLGGKTASEVGAEADQPQPQKRHIEKSFFFSVEDVQYNRLVCPMFFFLQAPEFSD